MSNINYSKLKMLKKIETDSKMSKKKICIYKIKVIN